MSIIHVTVVKMELQLIKVNKYLLKRHSLFNMQLTVLVGISAQEKQLIMTKLGLPARVCSANPQVMHFYSISFSFFPACRECLNRADLQGSIL